MMNPHQAIYFAQLKGSPVPDLEKFISQNPECAYEYASYIINGRFPQGEKTIAKNPEYAYRYAINIIKGRFLEGEKAIAKDPQYAYEYARDVIKGRFQKGEKAIVNYPEYAYNYARDVVNKEVIVHLNEIPHIATSINMLNIELINAIIPRTENLSDDLIIFVFQ